MFWFVCRNSGLLPALLQGKKVFSQFPASHADFYLILLNKTSLISQKNRNLVIWLQNALFQPSQHREHVLLCYQQHWASLSYISTNKKRFCFFVAKTRWNQLYSIKTIFWFVCRKIVSSPALLHLKKFFLQFAASHPGFLLHFTQKNVFSCVWLSDAVLESSF